jgi:hypothetical protein
MARKLSLHASHGRDGQVTDLQSEGRKICGGSGGSGAWVEGHRGLEVRDGCLGQ